MSRGGECVGERGQVENDCGGGAEDGKCEDNENDPEVRGVAELEN